MPNRRHHPDFETPRQPHRRPAKIRPTRLRIIAGELGGRYIEYNGDLVTRPMKEKTREAVFSLLGGYLTDCLAIDLFAGTGILGFESISRGAHAAVLLELARPAVASILANMRSLDLSDRVEVHNVDTLRWLRQASQRTAELPRCRWIVFCCPPYALWQNQPERLLGGIRDLLACMPHDSRLLCESAESFDVASHLPEWEWDVRTYRPAQVAIASI